VDRGTPAGRALIADAGLFGPESEGWRLNREAVLLLGAGPRALLLQIAHPLIAEGVDQHSDFRTDPWRRLTATLRSSLRLLYGDTAAARAEVARLAAIHATISGPVKDPGARATHGEQYSALDPELAMWVLATLVDSTIVAYDALVEPLDRERRERFYHEARLLARELGIDAAVVPGDLAAFEAYLARMLGPDGPIRVSLTARDLAATILRPPLGPLAAATPGLADIPGAATILGSVPATAYGWLYWPAIGLLPDRLRRDYGITWGRPQRFVAAWLTSAWRAWLPLIPPAVRWLPQARAAHRRVGLSSAP